MALSKFGIQPAACHSVTTSPARVHPCSIRRRTVTVASTFNNGNGNTSTLISKLALMAEQLGNVAKSAATTADMPVSNGVPVANPAHVRDGQSAMPTDQPTISTQAYFTKRHQQVLQYFPSALGVDDFVARVEVALCAYGFTGDNSIGKCWDVCIQSGKRNA